MSTIPLTQPSYDITTYKLIDPPKAKAPEWAYFKQYAANHERSRIYAVCVLCKEKEITESEKKRRKLNHENYEVKYEQSTSKLTRHVQHHHSEAYKELNKRKASQLLKGGGERFFKNVTSSKDKFYKFMIMTYQPLSFVENEYFRDWIGSISDNYKHMSRTGVKNTYAMLAAIMKEQIQDLLKGKHVALTGDKWSSIGHQGFLGLTVHFIDDSWNMQR